MQSDRKLWPFSVEADANGKPSIHVKAGDEAKALSAEEVSASILTKMKD